MKAAVLAVCPEARFVDISHSIVPFDVRAGGFVLWAGSRDFPAGTVHLAVIDPGVGSDRRALALEVGGSFFVGPDNGLFWLVAQRAEIVRAVALRRPRGASPTFEGRDVFAPAAGRLAGGAPLASLGRPIDDLVALPDPFGPVVLWVDNFGNLVTNLEPPIGSLSVGGRSIPGPLGTFADARRGEPFWYVGSLGLVEIGVREGRADQVLAAGQGTSLSVRPKP
jgi:S-adenosyl-L-methionine hydrolase (adenosine-forming)